MLALSVFIVFVFIYAVSASTDATCGVAYGRPSLTQCAALLDSLITNLNGYDRFMGVAGVYIHRPPEVTREEWARRITLPSVHSKGDCNLAFISILDLNGKYTWMVDNFRRIALLESPTHTPISPQSILGKCIVLRPLTTLGGFRQVPDQPGLIMVLYQSNSPYEQFLFSGQGAEHYDAAKELPGDIFLPFWIGVRRNSSLLNSTDRLSLPRPTNLTVADDDPSSVSLTSSRLKRSIKNYRGRQQP